MASVLQDFRYGLRMLAKKRDDRPRDFIDFLSKFRNLRLLKSDPIKKKSEP